MSMIINTNTFSMYAQSNMDRIQTAQQTTMERLSSGQRINQATDDAYGIALSDQYEAKINGAAQGKVNANNGISLLQVADGAMDNIADALQRMRELSLQSASGTYNGGNREQIQQEFKALQDEISRIVDVTTFDGVHILNRPLDGAEKLHFQVGNDAAGATTSGYFQSAPLEIENWGGVTLVGGAAGPNDTAGSYTGLELSTAVGNDTMLTTTATATFSLKVDNGSAVSVEIPAGNKSHTQWAEALESAINGTAALAEQGRSVEVSYSDEENRFLIHSTMLGEGSSVKLSSPNETAVLGFGLSSFGSTTSGTGVGTAASLTGTSVSNGFGTIDLSEEATFAVNVDGVQSDRITLQPQNGLLKTEWAAVLQNSINTDPQIASAGKSITVAYDQATDSYTMTTDSTGNQSSISLSYVSDEMASLGFRNTSQAEVITLEGLSEAERQITFTIDGEEQPTITLPAVAKRPQEWVEYLQQQLPEATISYDETLQQIQMDSMSDGYGSIVHFEGGVAALGLTTEGETFKGYGDINKVSVTHFDLDDEAGALGALLQGSETIALQSSAQGMLEKIDQAVGYINEARSEVGAVQNRLDRLVQQIEKQGTDYQQARSYIVDADFAAESAAMAKNDILKQVATAMMAQANQLPKQMLQLFK